MAAAIAHQCISLSFNLVAGIGVVLANKAVFTSAAFTFPTALTALHYASNYAVLLVLDVLAPFARTQPSSADFAALSLTTAVWALHNSLSNLSLHRNSVGLYQISKILVTPLIVLLEFVLYRKVPRPLLALALIGACAGVALATVNDVSVSARGMAYALSSACASSVLKVVQQEMLQRRGYSSLALMRHTWGAQTLLLLLSVPVLDARAASLVDYELTPWRLGLLALSAGAAFALNVSSLLAIQLTSAIAIVLLSQAKTVTTMLGGYLFFDGAPNERQLLGATLAIVSLSAYTYGSLALASKDQSAPRVEVGDHAARGHEPPDEGQLEQQPLTGEEK